VPEPELERIRVGGAPEPLGSYAHAVRAGGFLFCSGQGARDPATGREVGVILAPDGSVARVDAGMQTEQCFANLARVLEAAGSGLDRVVEVTVFLVDMADFGAMNAVFAAQFPDGGPARTTVGVAALPGRNVVELRAVALA